MGDARRTVAAALVVPPLVATACVIAVSIAERTGGTIFAAAAPANLAEAAALGRGDDVVRRLHQGEDPRRVYDLRPEIVSSAVVKATPMEAAMWSQRLLMIHLLDRGGAIADEAARSHLACLAMDLGLAEAVDYLASATAPACVPGEARNRVLARTTGAANE